MQKISRSFDIYIRLPQAKKKIKEDLKEVAKRNGMTLTQLVIQILEQFLSEINKGPVSFSIK